MAKPTVEPAVEPAPVDSQRLEMYRAIASVIAASAAVLATRLLLFLALLGGFALAVIAAIGGSWMAFAVLCAYAVLIIIPLILLEHGTIWRG